MDKVYYATITEDDEGIETYSIPRPLAKAVSADITVDILEDDFYADDGICYSFKEFKSGKLTMNIHDLPQDVIVDITGARIDENGVLISSSENSGKTVAVAFRAKRPEGNYRYLWLTKVKFASPSTNLQTKGNSIQFNTPKIEGTIMRRNKPDAFDEHPWKYEAIAGAAGVPATVITNWFAAVYEPVAPPEE
jgi:phi13 family phage major tail protein